MEIAKVSTVTRTAKKLIETITVQPVTLSSAEFLLRLQMSFSTMFLDENIASFIRGPSAFCKSHIAYALIFNELSSESRSAVPVLSNTWT
jgi:hypothetical protein